ncbi:hypothetical protein Pcinc_014620 [Petrolisthes cinctipes]|uniref:Uncharacterized protein n=1 Tax=Petrolisthes cinctipes TaxID=88211 RepID=A0AAE1KP11_PETCI|nr:hypothetical protein Pcinc_014620 [Petrolisthes cinctipes]
MKETVSRLYHKQSVTLGSLFIVTSVAIAGAVPYNVFNHNNSHSSFSSPVFLSSTSSSASSLSSTSTPPSSLSSASSSSPLSSTSSASTFTPSSLSSMNSSSTFSFSSSSSSFTNYEGSVMTTSEGEDVWVIEVNSNSSLCEGYVLDQTRSLYLGERLLEARHNLHLRGLHLLGLLQHYESEYIDDPPPLQAHDDHLDEPPQAHDDLDAPLQSQDDLDEPLQTHDDLDPPPQTWYDLDTPLHHQERRDDHYQYQQPVKYYPEVKCKHSNTGIFSFLAFCILSFDITADIMKSINISIDIGKA